jgi:hypothetical protein
MGADCRVAGNCLAGAEVPDLDTDIGTGKEGDIEARCFRKLHDQV